MTKKTARLRSDLFIEEERNAFLSHKQGPHKTSHTRCSYSFSFFFSTQEKEEEMRRMAYGGEKEEDEHGNGAAESSHTSVCLLTPPFQSELLKVL